ncbi:MAG: PssD/Cps14F family polysaccharide biosynthesis glycosyltransferase [Candidatus Diapherotrites archaeon]|nr:UDP-N-acetylglucosamine--LPS N-acetylglucosamine transferase [Candidatus Micrarchaeota archaeon]MBU1940110.1 UDP-N-acetylglucosamine--LPS N-acetylglucosamine transferase [Candidatus Micrarchaeota archaeon]
MGGMKLCLACSGGGHLSELMQLEEFYGNKEHFFLTFKRPNSETLAQSGKERVHFVVDPGRNVLKLIVNIAQSVLVFFMERPDAVLTTGAGVAVPISYIAKLFGKKVIYIESFCRLDSASLCGKLMHPVSDLFLVQWPEGKKFFRKAVFKGGVF